jgi:hypothetical protein
MKNSISKLTLKALLFANLVTALLSTSCKKKEENHEYGHLHDSNEVISTVQYVLTNTDDPTDVVTGTFKDTTLIKGWNNATQASLTLRKNSTYNGVISLIDETKNPAIVMTPEIIKLANEHLFGYRFTAGIDTIATITLTDLDTKNPPLPLGVKTQIVLKNTATTGKLNVVLKHQPNTKNGTITTGSTDVDCAFDIVVR